MSAGRLSEHFEVEIALLAGVFGLFVGAIASLNREILDIAVIAVITAAVCFFGAYYAVKLIFAGRGSTSGAGREDGGFKEIETLPRVETKKDRAAKGRKLDVRTPDDDDLFNDIYGKK